MTDPVVPRADPSPADGGGPYGGRSLRHPVAAQWGLALGALVILALLGAGLRADHTSAVNPYLGGNAPGRSSLATVQSWALLVQSGDALEAGTDLAPSARSQVPAGAGSPAGWGIGDQASCQVVGASPEQTVVRCAVRPAGEQVRSGGDIWTLLVSRRSDGRWFIDRFQRLEVAG